MKHTKARAFTLIELLVVIGIIGLLASAVLSGVGGARAKARDTVRRSDMIQLKNSLELYYAENGGYPIAAGWHGYLTTACGTAAGLTGPGGYIPNLSPKFIVTLPVDPSRTFGGCNGYLYQSNGSVYKLLSHATPESFPSVGRLFYDPMRPTWSWMLCNGEPACSTW